VSYGPGQRVRVAARAHEGHHRTPTYVKGKTGTVQRVHDSFANPETRAYGGDGLPTRRLYLVGFAASDLWPRYDGDAEDRVLLDIFEHWLEEPE
jgi:hypothetical protein